MEFHSIQHQICNLSLRFQINDQQIRCLLVSVLLFSYVTGVVNFYNTAFL